MLPPKPVAEGLGVHLEFCKDLHCPSVTPYSRLDTFFIVARALDAAAPHGGQTAVKASHYYDSDASRKFQTPPCRR
ncbi:hypothetical protein E4T56_gene7560, partial [Termitomyces sp. T112]